MYGLTKEIKEKALLKIERQKAYLSNNYFKIGSDNIKMIDVFKNSFINSDRYIAEVNHRVYSLYDYSNSKGLVNIFGTITLPTEYHPYKTLKNGKKVNNPYYCNKKNIPLIDRVYDIKTKRHILTPKQKDLYSPNAGAKKLSKMFKALQDTRQYKSINVDEKCFFRVYEPHISGVPHLHFSMFVPPCAVDTLISVFYSYFEKNYPKLRVDFQKDINNPVAYLMKYVLKTVDDLRDNKDITELSLWYIANKITRFYTSKTLISLEVYRKLHGKYDLLQLTRMYQNKEISILLDLETNKILQINDKYSTIYNKKQIELKSFDDDYKQIDFQNEIRYKRQKMLKKHLNKSIPIIIDDIPYSLQGHELVTNLSYYEKDIIIPIKYRKNKDLLSEYEQLNITDINLIDLNYYGLIKNELITRGILFDDDYKQIFDLVPMGLYNSNFDF